MLEGLVFGRIAALRAIESFSDPGPASSGTRSESSAAPTETDPERTRAVVNRIKAIMSAQVGVDRTADGLRAALADLEPLEREAASFGTSLPEIEARNMLTAARAIAGAALHREESRGGHYRSDFPSTDPAFTGNTRSSPVANASGDTERFDDEIEHGASLLPAYASAMQRFWDCPITTKDHESVRIR
ncbi:MAG: hypothetical protein R2845_11600 [Thermomicrobiales bacterium]